MSPPQVSEDGVPSYTREEVAQHKESTDCWVILHGQVYDVTKWLGKHPGGARLIMHYAGQDATVSFLAANAAERVVHQPNIELETLRPRRGSNVGGGYKATAKSHDLVGSVTAFLPTPMQLAWTSFHHNKAMVRKYLAQYHIGKICPEQKEVYYIIILHANLYCFMAIFVPQLQPIEKDFLTLRDKMEAKVSNSKNR